MAWIAFSTSRWELQDAGMFPHTFTCELCVQATPDTDPTTFRSAVNITDLTEDEHSSLVLMMNFWDSTLRLQQKHHLLDMLEATLGVPESARDVVVYLFIERLGLLDSECIGLVEMRKDLQERHYGPDVHHVATPLSVWDIWNVDGSDGERESDEDE
ncbi:hypothetical protein DFH07DRAFT_783140 [Mycena maculata]|uniref:Uncharacterized protein n=1 Tax=Mycena maculata TaxID=230809 RepID=A0AAD7MNI0_9AGAR|nr:hypothetical protein DFH07DRAFT_783140 [Mycena maculata]